MRKGDAIAKFEQLMRDMFLNTSYISTATCFTAAVNILELADEIGMSPPHRPILAGNPNIKTDEDCATLPALIIKDVQTWEPEDEKTN